MRLGFIDTETVSDLDIKRAGTVRYAEAAGCLCVTWIAPGGTRCRLWECHKGPMPEDLRALLLDLTIKWAAHNALFDRTVIAKLLPEAEHLRQPEQWVCTAALARYYGLPGALGEVAKRLDLPPEMQKRDDSGGIDYFTKRYSRNYRTPEQDPARWYRFMEYAIQDTVTCRAVYYELRNRLPFAAAEHWAKHERDVFLWDQHVNQKGIAVDAQMLDSVLAMIATLSPLLEAEMADLTGGEVTKLGSPKLLTYLRSEFLMELPNMQEATRLAVLENADDLDPRARAILELRHYGHKNSLAKFGRMDAMLSPDGRVRGGFLYGGAHTMRWSGQGFQPQNLTRPLHGLDPPEVARSVVACNGDHEGLKLLYDEQPYEVLVSGIRGAIVAARGNILVIPDYNQIESRLTAYLSGCERKLQAFRDHDQGLSDLDPYEVTALDVLGDSSLRQEGKTMDLGLGFGMGAKKFALVSGLPYPRAKELCDAWRSTYSEIPGLWGAISAMFLDAVPGADSWSRHEAKPVIRRLASLGITVTRDNHKVGNVTLPNGAPRFYHTLRNATWGENLRYSAMFGRRAQTLQTFERAYGRPYTDEDANGYDRRQIAFKGTYGNIRLVHGGFLAENFVQGIAREVMAEHVVRIWKETGEVAVLHAHDEPVYEVPEREAQAFADHVVGVMESTPASLPGLPLKAEVKFSTRYTK